jgi:hypothetical protein
LGTARVERLVEEPGRPRGVGETLRLTGINNRQVAPLGVGGVRSSEEAG